MVIVPGAQGALQRQRCAGGRLRSANRQALERRESHRLVFVVALVGQRAPLEQAEAVEREPQCGG